MVELGAVKHGEVAKIVLQPTRLCLTGGHEHCSYEPSGPRVSKVPQHPPGSKEKEVDVQEMSNEEWDTWFEEAL